MNQIKINVEDGKITVRGPYSEANNSKWRGLGGKFSDGKWVLPDNASSRQTVADLFGEKSDDIEVLVPCTSDGKIVQIGGYVLAQRRGRDSRVEIPDGVSLAAGRLPSCGGSVKHPRVNADTGTIFRVWLRKSFAEKHSLEIVQDIPEAEKLSV